METIRTHTASNIFSFKSLHVAYKSCLKGKVNKRSSAKFEVDREENLLALSRELRARSYKPGTFTCFAISDPKLREVWAADFRDRIVHHLLVSKIEPVWEKIFVHDSYACRTEKGAHKAVNKLKKILARQANLWYLHVDIRGFFTSIDKRILYKILSRKNHHPDIDYLIRQTIFHDPRSNYILKGDEKLLKSVPRHKSLFGTKGDKGLPIGNYTSQFFANVYLNELDQYAKRTLKCKCYFRYMDDIVILDKDQIQLRCLVKEIDRFLKDKLDLELHPGKTTLQETKTGVNFLGYVIHPDYALSRKRVVGNIKMKLKNLNAELKNSAADAEGIEKIARLAQCIVNSYWGHFKHADCGKLKERLYDKHFGELKKYLEKSKDGGHFLIKNGVFLKGTAPF